MRTMGARWTAAAAACFAVANAARAAPDAVSWSAAETPARWLVELASPPSSEGTPPSVLGAERAAFREEARRAGVAVEERRAFELLFNGVSVEAAPGAIDRLARLPGVKALHPVRTIAPPGPPLAGPELLTAVEMTGATWARSALGLTGAGVRVGVIDSGIDYDHPAFGGDGSARSDSAAWAGPGGTNPGSRVVAGWDFVGDAYDADAASPTFDPVPAPDPRPDDCAGHGTHVAGVVGASAGVGSLEPPGVAPGVVFGAYRVFGCAGPTTEDLVLAAMERALEDRMDVVNLSLGAPHAWPQAPLARAASRLVGRGVVVVASAGNEGATGAFAASAPGVGEGVLAVASFENVGQVLPLLRLSPDGRAVGFTPAVGAPPVAGTAPLAVSGTGFGERFACIPLEPGSLAGKVALVSHGGCPFRTKGYYAQLAGAAAVIVHELRPSLVPPAVTGSRPVDIPMVLVSSEDGAWLRARLAEGPVEVTWTAERASFPVGPRGGLVSWFSSHGLAPDLSLKPDLGAPGGAVHSTFPVERGGYATLSGTSMASPHVAGAAALLLEARPRARPGEIRAALQNTAVPALWSGGPSYGFLDGAWRQGAGMVRVDDAATAAARVEPSALALGESAEGPSAVTLLVANDGETDLTFDLLHEPGLAVNGPVANLLWTAFAAVEFAEPSVTVRARARAAVRATVTAPAPAGEFDRALYGGWIVLAPRDGGRALRVPYAGFVADYQSLPVLVPGLYGLPWLARAAGPLLEHQPAGGTFTLRDGDVPWIVLNLGHPARELRIRIVEAATGRPRHDAFRAEYVPRSGSAASFVALPWSGETSTPGGRTSPVPDGTYLAIVEARKALGGPGDVETWTSPPITIARP